MDIREYKRQLRDWLIENISPAFYDTVAELPIDNGGYINFTGLWCSPDWAVGTVVKDGNAEVHVYISNKFEQEKTRICLLAPIGGYISLVLSDRFKYLITNVDKTIDGHGYPDGL